MTIIVCAECQGEMFRLALREDGSTQLACYHHDSHLRALRENVSYKARHAKPETE